MYKFVVISTVLLAIACSSASAFYCTSSATYGPCVVLDAFPVLNQIMNNMTIITATPISNDSATGAAMKSIVYNYTDALCRTAQPIINCIGAANFSDCDEEAANGNKEALVAINVYNSFRLINYGCSLWLSGGADIETDCPNYKNLFDSCASYAPGVPMLREFTGFFGDSGNMNNYTDINVTDCDAYKMRTGCIVAQFKKSCLSSRSYELPWWMARYQLDLSNTPKHVCQFTSSDTADKLSNAYTSSISTTAATQSAGQNGVNADAQRSSASNLSFQSAVLLITAAYGLL